MASIKKGKNGRRLDRNRITLRKGESQRKDSTYQYRWTTPDQKRHTVYATTLEELREKEDAILKDLQDRIMVDANKLTVNDVFELWCDVKRGLKDNTFRNYKYMYNLFVRDGFGQNRITVKKSDVKRFYNNLADDKILKISTIDSIHTVLRQVFDLARDDHMIRFNPTENVLRELKKAHNFGVEKRKALTIAEQKLLIDFLKRNPRYRHWYPVFAVMLGTGMRVGETVGLRWCDVDLDNKLIDINHTLVYYNHDDGNGCSFSVNTPKTKAGERIIPMIDAVKEAFLLEKELQEELEVSCNVSVDCYTDFIFINRFGGVQHQGTLNKAIRRITRDCNDEELMKAAENEDENEDPVLLPKFSCHTLRRTFTTRLCESGVNIKVIQDALGHADISTTMNIYADVTDDMRHKEFKTLSDYYDDNDV